MKGNERKMHLPKHLPRILIKALGLLVMMLAAVNVILSMDWIELTALSAGGVFAFSLDVLCLVLGVFLFAGMASMQGRSTRFLILFFLNQMLLAADAILWIVEGNVQYVGIHSAVLIFLYFFDLLSVPFFVLLTRQVTAGEVSTGKLLRTESKLDRAELIITGACTLATLLIWLLDIQRNAVFYIDANGCSQTGPLYRLYCLFLTLPRVFCLVRIFRAKIGFAKKIPLLLYIFLPILFYFIGPEKGGDDMIYALVFIVLLVTFGQFFSTIGLQNEKMKNVLGTYVSEDVVKHLLKEKDSQAGRRYTATALLTDLRGFTSTSGHLSTEDTVAILNHWLSEMSEVIRDLNGTVTEFLGDGFLVIFGAPTEMKDHADRAVAAALKMQEKTAETSRWNEEHGYPAIRMGIGLSSGELLFGSFGTKRVSRLMAIGTPVNLAFAAEEKTLGGQILITPETKELLTAPVEGTRIENIGGMDLFSVTGLGGDWNIHPERKEEPPVDLAKPIRIRIRRLSGKDTMEEEFSGELIAASTRKAAILSEQPLMSYEQIRFHMEEEVSETVYARTGGESTGAGELCRIDITVCPRHSQVFQTSGQ